VDELEALHGISDDEPPPTIGLIAAVGDFHSAPRRGRFDFEHQGMRTRHDHVAEADDEVVLSDVANVSLLAEEGLSTTAIAADLGLTPAEVVTDLKIAAEVWLHDTLSGARRADKKGQQDGNCENRRDDV
jgi:hypothetical protein